MSGKVPEYAKLKVAFELAKSDVFKTYAFGIQRPFNEIVCAHGFNNEEDFWNIALSEPMSEISFVHLLRDALLPEALKEVTNGEKTWRSAVDLLEISICDAIKFAIHTGERWIITTSVGERLIEPRQAAEWLLSKPLRAGLVPVGLRAFLEGAIPLIQDTIVDSAIDQSESCNVEPGSGATSKPISDAMLRDYLASLKASTNKVPAVKKAYELAQDVFANHKVSRSHVERVHAALFGKQRPGKR